MLHSMEQAVSNHLAVIKKFIVTDANHNDSKQASDIDDLVSRGVDLLIVSANTEQALDPVPPSGHGGFQAIPGHQNLGHGLLRLESRQREDPDGCNDPEVWQED
jgi:hypothetical protein